MAEVLIPTWIVPEDETQEWLDEGTSAFAAEFAPGLAQRQSYGGLRLKLSRKHTVRGEEKAQLLSILKSTKGRYNAVRTKVHFALRGSFPATELLTNNTFANGTTGWSASGSATISVSDRNLRLSAAYNDGTNSPSFSQSAWAQTNYAPFALRSFIASGSYNLSTAGPHLVGADGVTITNAAGPGYRVAAGVFGPGGTTTLARPAVFNPTGFQAGDYLTVPWCSLSRCALVDKQTNALLRSDEFDNASWTKSNATATPNAFTAPDGTTTADALNENTSTSQHYARQNYTIAAAAADQCFGIAVRGGTRTFLAIQLLENTGSTAVTGYFNTSTGAFGTTATGANWSNLRTFVVNLGNSWYGIYIVARKTNAATSISATAYLASADNTASYLGDGSGLHLWRATVAQSSVPVRLTQTTTAASSGTSQTGSALRIKGLPVSTNGLLLPEDIFEINGELKQCTAALNSDAAGLGYLQFEPGLIRSPADNDPIIITDPMGKFLVSNLKVDNEFGTQAIVTYDLEHIYE